MQDRSTAVTRDLLEDRLPAGIARALVADLRAGVSAAFQRPPTHTSADMLRLDVFVRWTEMRSKLPSHSLAFDSLLFTGTASLAA